MSLFLLSKGVLFTEGISNGLIINTNLGELYSINKQACQVIRGEINDESFWYVLHDLKLISSSTETQLNEVPKKKKRAQLKFVWFEIVSDMCNHYCIHCYAGSEPFQKTPINAQDKKDPDTRGRSKNLSTQKMSYKDWTNAIKESYELGCQKCQFIGGEPLLYKSETSETLLDLLNEANNTGYQKIELFTNATLLNERIVRKFKVLGISVATSLYSNIPEVHDSITNIPGSHKRLIRSLKLLQDYGIPTRVEIVLMKANQDSINSTVLLRKELNLDGRKPDPLRPTGRGEDQQLQPDRQYLLEYGLQLEPKFKIDYNSILNNYNENTCLQGKIAITERGDILPCIFSRGQVVGNILVTGSIQPIIIGEKLVSIWSSTKDNVMVCRDCEFRYLCSDCRPLSETTSQGYANFLSAPYPRCTYNPYTGAWGKGIWRVRNDGLPYYETDYFK